MDLSGERAEVPSGAILAALQMIEVTGEDQEAAAGRVGEITTLVNAWGVPVLTQAFSLLIFGAMSAIRPAEGEPDRLHLIVPAVLTRLGQVDWARPFLPTMAGVLTAAALGDDIWQWRVGLSPVSRAETAAWCYTAWLLADLTDSVGFGKPGTFSRIAAEIVTSAADGGDLNDPELG
jgi:hypothetical protein